MIRMEVTSKEIGKLLSVNQVVKNTFRRYLINDQGLMITSSNLAETTSISNFNLTATDDDNAYVNDLGDHYAASPLAADIYDWIKRLIDYDVIVELDASQVHAILVAQSTKLKRKDIVAVVYNESKLCIEDINGTLHPFGRLHDIRFQEEMFMAAGSMMQEVTSSYTRLDDLMFVQLIEGFAVQIDTQHGIMSLAASPFKEINKNTEVHYYSQDHDNDELFYGWLCSLKDNVQILHRMVIFNMDKA